jgi:hypothetical protein
LCFGILAGAADGRAGRARKCTEGDLGDVYELGAFFLVEDFKKHALGHGGDEAADVVLAAKEGHGKAVSLGG